ncbi:hypothetical protein [Polaromonas sp. SM01]|uniref:hypothetical protein n=1 Tax=Polaromonas sp. SM01 TaxID=3085630 RepID=UPI0029829610|nr:hypothetical protein [Polaromonas sp. SM01]
MQKNENHVVSTIYNANRRREIDEIKTHHHALRARLKSLDPESLATEMTNMSQKAKRPHEVGVLGTRPGGLEVGCAGKI